MAKATKNEVATQGKNELTFQQRFTNKVTDLFQTQSGEKVALTDFQKRLAQNYCIEVDSVLKKAEAKRLAKDEKWREKLPYTWANVAMEELAIDVVAAARVGLDPAQKNHVNLIPFKDSALNKYRVTFIDGYRGIELKAVKYAIDPPDAVTVEVIHKNDKFRQIKKDRNNPIDTYEFEIVSPFDRGDIVGGFYYHQYEDNPSKNKLVVMTLKDILKRKPDKASVEFWGGEKDVWEKDEKTGRNKKVGKEKVEGWYKEMCWKTLYRAAYNDLTIDSQKIDDDYMRLKTVEKQFIEAEVEQEIAENANTVELDFEDKDVIESKAEVIEGEQQDSVIEADAEVLDDEDLPDFLKE